MQATGFRVWGLGLGLRAHSALLRISDAVQVGRALVGEVVEDVAGLLGGLTPLGRAEDEVHPRM